MLIYLLNTEPINTIAPQNIFKWGPILFRSSNYIKHVTNNELAAFIINWRSIIIIIFMILVTIITIVWLHYHYTQK